MPTHYYIGLGIVAAVVIAFAVLATLDVLVFQKRRFKREQGIPLNEKTRDFYARLQTAKAQQPHHD